MSLHTRDTLFQRPDKLHAPLHVITMVTNPIRFRSRWKLYEDFAKHVEDHHGVLYTAELRFGDRDFSVTDASNPRHIQIETRSELWHKENVLNLLMQRLPIDWEYVAWIDADISFARGDIFNETLHQLQHYQVVQMWSEAQDLDSNSQVIQQHKSFAYCWKHGFPYRQEDDGFYPYHQDRKKMVYWHPGFAWAARREAIDWLGGLIDFCILGSADHHMAHALVGEIERTLLSGLNERYKYMLRRWQDRCEKYIKRNVGYVPGLVLHNWHGPKSDRRYNDRWKILTDCDYDPDVDLKRDWQGVFQLTDRSLELRDKLRAYMRNRNEDQISSDDVWLKSMLIEGGLEL